MFDGPQRAIRCAMAIRDAVQALGIEVRAGLHTGECEVRGDDIGGIAVHIGARVSALAGPNDVLVSSTLRDTRDRIRTRYSRDRGAHELKGVPGAWHLFAVASHVAMTAVKTAAGPCPLGVAAERGNRRRRNRFRHSRAAPGSERVRRRDQSHSRRPEPLHSPRPTTDGGVNCYRRRYHQCEDYCLWALWGLSVGAGPGGLGIAAAAVQELHPGQAGWGVQYPVDLGVLPGQAGSRQRRHRM